MKTSFLMKNNQIITKNRFLWKIVFTIKYIYIYNKVFNSKWPEYRVHRFEQPLLHQLCSDFHELGLIKRRNKRSCNGWISVPWNSRCKQIIFVGNLKPLACFNRKDICLSRFKGLITECMVFTLKWDSKSLAIRYTPIDCTWSLV